MHWSELHRGTGRTTRMLDCAAAKFKAGEGVLVVLPTKASMLAAADYLREHHNIRWTSANHANHETVLAKDNENGRLVLEHNATSRNNRYVLAALSKHPVCHSRAISDDRPSRFIPLKALIDHYVLEMMFAQELHLIHQFDRLA